jgi:parallel beta-helix repeat protein
MKEPHKATPLTFHISVEGDDNWSGALAAPNAARTDGPKATLAAVREKLRQLRQAGELNGPVKALVHTGVYRLSETLRFEPEDLGDEDSPVIYQAAGDGEVTISGGLKLQGFTPHKAKVVKLDLREAGYAGLRFRQLLHKGVRQQLARYPGFDPTNPYGGGWLYVEGELPNIYEKGAGQRDRFICRDPRLQGWSNFEEIELFIYPRYNWHNDSVRLKSYDKTTGEVVLSRPAVWEIYPGDRFYFRNVREELTAPGEWYLDEAAETLYFYPPVEDTGPVVVEAPHLEHLIEVNGPPQPGVWESQQVDGSGKWLDKDDEWNDRDDQLRQSYDPRKITDGYLTFRGLTLEGCNGSGIVVRNARSCLIEGCAIRNTGGTGVKIRGGAACKISDCDVYKVGGAGIALWGGLRTPHGSLYLACHNEALNNYVHHVGVFAKHVAGIAVNGVGIRVAHNLIHDAPRWGIISHGNDNLLEFNHIHHVNIETSDTAAIYIVDRDFSMRGTKIQYNHIHDILGYHRINGVWSSPAYAFGIYLDDWTSGVEIRGNLVYRTPNAGVYLNSGQDNLVENNILLDCRDELISCNRWNSAMEMKHCGTHNQGMRRNVFRRNILTSAGEKTLLYRFSKTVSEDGSLDLATNQWDNNLIWRDGKEVQVGIGGTLAAERILINWESWQASGFDKNSLIADPLLKDDFSLASESPAFGLGFEPLPVEKMGPYRSELRSEWPIVEAAGVREFPLVPA